MFWVGRKIRNEEFPCPNTPIPHFKAYLIHYFYYLKTIDARLKRISDSELGLASKI